LVTNYDNLLSPKTDKILDPDKTPVKVVNCDEKVMIRCAFMKQKKEHLQIKSKFIWWKNAMASYKCFTPATRQPRSRFFKDKTVVQKYFENTQFNYALITSQLSDNDGTLHAPCLKHIYVL
jgi:hypothetical protein